jgi:MoaA/NifB/PqqE/SkfB family radical SAM enzyme
MCVNRVNLKEMVSLVQIAEELEVKNIHYLWLFRKGGAKEEKKINSKLIFQELIKAYKLAQEKNIFIDNMEIIKSQIFSLPGTRFDLSNAGWESLAISPEGYIYPSPALIFEKDPIRILRAIRFAAQFDFTG